MIQGWNTHDEMISQAQYGRRMMQNELEGDYEQSIDQKVSNPYMRECFSGNSAMPPVVTDTLELRHPFNHPKSTLRHNFRDRDMRKGSVSNELAENRKPFLTGHRKFLANLQETQSPIEVTLVNGQVYTGTIRTSDEETISLESRSEKGDSYTVRVIFKHNLVMFSPINTVTTAPRPS
ncbi:RNA chaperone Hfq [Acinetobacter baumannii]